MVPSLLNFWRVMTYSQCCKWFSFLYSPVLFLLSLKSSSFQILLQRVLSLLSNNDFMSIPGNLKMFGEIFKYLIRDSILLNQLFFLFSYKYLDSEKALRSKISSLVYKRFKYLNILIIISMYSGYLPNSPIMANDVDRFPTPNMYLQNFRWTCSCFKLLNSFEIK